MFWKRPNKVAQSTWDPNLKHVGSASPPVRSSVSGPPTRTVGSASLDGPVVRCGVLPMSKRSHSQTDDLHNPECTCWSFLRWRRYLMHCTVFEVVNRYYRCIVCIRHLPQLKADAVRHENSVRHVEALRARDGDNSDNNTENENNAMPSTQRLTPNFSPPSVHGPALACDRPDQLYHSCSPKPPPIIQETILLGALETMEQGYQMTALDLGTLLQAPEWSSGSPAPSSESSTTSSSDTEARITDGNLTFDSSAFCTLLY